MSPEAAVLETLEDDLAKGNLVGEEAEAAQKTLDEAKAEDAATTKDEDADAIKAADEDKSEDDKKADDKVAEEKAAEEKAELEAKEVYEKLSDEEKAEADKKVSEAAEAELQAERDKRNKGIKIPKFRLDAATARAKKAEIERDELQAQLLVAEQKAAEANTNALSDDQIHDNELSAIDKRIAEAMKDGDADVVSNLMAESRGLEREYQAGVSQHNLQQASEDTRASMDESSLVNSILDQLEEQYPMFNEASDEFNPEANADVIRVQEGFIASGSTAADALVEAVNLVLPKYGIFEDKPAEDKPADDKPADDVSAKRAADDKKTQVSKNLTAASKIPPEMGNAGGDSDTAGAQSKLPDVNDLTDEEYDALPAATLKEMRGDSF